MYGVIGVYQLMVYFLNFRIQLSGTRNLYVVQDNRMLADFVKDYLKLIQLDPQLVILFGKIRKFVDFFLEAVEQSLVGGNFLLDFRYIGLAVNYDRLQFMLKLSYYFVNVICSCIKIVNSHALFIVFLRSRIFFGIIYLCVIDSFFIMPDIFQFDTVRRYI